MRLGDVGPDGALCQPARVLYFSCLFCEHVDKGFADCLTFELRIRYTLAGGKETVCGAYSLYVEAFALIVRQNVLELVLAKQSVVYENAVKTVSDGLVY